MRHQNAAPDAALCGLQVGLLLLAAIAQSACGQPTDARGAGAGSEGGRGGTRPKADAGAAPTAGQGSARPAASSVVLLPDTQFYACAYPTIFQAQVQWIAEQAAARQIALVLHTGDLVDTNIPAQWDVISGLHDLDDVVPYMLTSGNHDLNAQRASLIAEYFDPTEFAEDIQFQEPTRPDNSYAVIHVAGRDWLFLGLEFAPRDAVGKWASGVLASHPTLPSVLFTHAYLYSDGQRYDRAVVPAQPYHPDSYEVTPKQGINDGEDLWRKLVLPNENVRLVLSGHVIPDGTARSIATRPSGSVVHEVLTNYQTCDLCPCAEAEGGGGYLRILKFDENSDSVHVSTYSPYKDQALTDEENAFDLSW
jgi:DNA repair exonuclease SbcCD nuclease subunit